MIKLLHQLYLTYIQTGGEIAGLSNQLLLLFGIATFHYLSINEFFNFISNKPKILLLHLSTTYLINSFIKFWNFKMLFRQSPIEWINVPRPPFLVNSI